MPPRAPAARKPKGPAPAPDVYVALLFASVAALIFGCILLGMELQAYEWAFPSGG